LQRWVRDLNRIYQDEPALFDADFDAGGFSWIDCNDHEHSIIALMRQGKRPAVEAAGAPADTLVGVVNFTPVPRRDYRLGVPHRGSYREVLNSDADIYGGSNIGNNGAVVAEAKPSHGHEFSLSLSVPPLGFLLLKSNK
jgi:1,4-alpha-glucan branching enzyme